MANTEPTMPDTGTEPPLGLLRADQLSFRHALDLYFAALQADWGYYAGRQKNALSAAADLAHAAAATWADYTTLLQEIRNFPGAHPDLRSAAGYLLRSAPEETPTERSLHQLATQVLKLTQQHRPSRTGLRALLEEAVDLLDVHSANQAVISLQTRANTSSF
ncbi:hypothetical protein HTT03_09320 [Sulfitobacter sp. S0837]|uniref:hypothetical protein n=1 Tax=Sulfitobacter maritimus TaxID=2741719 RepID=UPI001582C620|nr:hypothetical protein [Sulfitobacter maritimus]NUH65485.1 hypothetical protein [Sulfitobacter maritimus]